MPGLFAGTKILQKTLYFEGYSIGFFNEAGTLWDFGHPEYEMAVGNFLLYI